MPVHDWNRVPPGIFHFFHNRWIGTISDLLNGGLLPPSYYAIGEQVTGNWEPDVLALQARGQDPLPSPGGWQSLHNVAVAPPQVDHIARTELETYVRRQLTLVIRHTSGDRVVALTEIVSPGNKASRHALNMFVEKVVDALYQGIHILVVDVCPSGPRDPDGIHGAIWSEISPDPYHSPPGMPLTLVAYSSGEEKTAFVKRLACGDALPAMPLFLEPDLYLHIPLEQAYTRAYESVPRRWREVLEQA